MRVNQRASSQLNAGLQSVTRASLPHGRRVLDREFWRKRRRRFAARAVTRATGLIGASPRLRGLALRELLDQHLAPGALCLVPFGDHALYVDPRDDKIALKLMAGRCWQRRELETAIDALGNANALRRGGLFIDVGANVGALSIYAMKSGAFSGSIAIEPDPHNFALLTRNVSLNGFEHRVQAVEAAASAASGHLLLARHRKNHGAHSVESTFHTRPAECVGVRAFTIDDLLGEYAVVPNAVSLVKIDVEGHELAVLEGMSQLLQARVPILLELTAERADLERLQRLKTLMSPRYEYVIDLSNGSTASRPAQPLSDLTWRASQADLLIY